MSESVDNIFQMENGRNALERGNSNDSSNVWQNLFQSLTQPKHNTINISQLENYINDATDEEVHSIFYYLHIEDF